MTDNSGSEPTRDDQVQRDLGQAQRDVRAIRSDIRELRGLIDLVPLALIPSILAVGLLVLMGTTWLVLDGPGRHEARVSSPHTGLGLLNMPWGDEESLAQGFAIAAVLVYVLAAIVMVFAFAMSHIVAPLTFAGAGLAATIVLILAKPSYRFAEEADWDYAWQSPPYIAALLWVMMLGFAARRTSR